MNDHIFGESGYVCLFESRIVKIIEVIEDDNRVSGREQPLNQMAADKTRSARDQDSHSLRLSRCTRMDTDFTARLRDDRAVAAGAHRGPPWRDFIEPRS